MATEEQLELYRNYLATLYYHREYGDKYGDTQELIEMYERELNMKEQYRWNYDIKIKTKEGTFEYEQETLDRIDEILNKHPNYTELQATHKLIKRRNNDNKRGTRTIQNT